MVNLRSYLLDRTGLVVLFMGNLVLTLTAVSLGILQQGVSLRWTDLAYLVMLSAAVLMVYLAIGYLRRRAFYREIGAVEAGPAELEAVLRLQSAVDREEQALQQLLHGHYRANAEELLRLRQQERRHHEFIQQWVHQMKTPVAVIDLIVQQSGTRDQTTEERECMASIGEECERLSHGLSMVLHTARLERFEMDVHIRTIGLTGLLRQLINSRKKTWIRYALFPRLEAPQEEVLVESDQKWLEFMLQQFISNAIKYSLLPRTERTPASAGSGAASDQARDAESCQAPDGETAQNGSSLLHFTVERTDGGKVLLRVRDEGPGIPAYDLPRIFDPFFTGDNGRRTKESTGMGLYIAKQVCRKLGHGLNAESEPGRGTEIILSFYPRNGLHDLPKETPDGSPDKARDGSPDDTPADNPAQVTRM